MRSDRERLLDILEAIERIECQATRGYFEIDNELVWSAVKNDLPKLAKQVHSILEEIR